jgi:hypothetical protein
MDQIISRYKIEGIWHFTDRANIELIKQHGGLLSHAELMRRNVAIPAPGGNDWSHDADHNRGLDEYVHLAFVDDHPMLYVAKQDGRIQNAIWLKINIAVLQIPGVLYCPDVSNKTGVPTLSADAAAAQIDFEVLYTWLDWRDPAIQQRLRTARKSEILVPNFIPINYIMGWKNG